MNLFTKAVGGRAYAWLAMVDVACEALRWLTLLAMSLNIASIANTVSQRYSPKLIKPLSSSWCYYRDVFNFEAAQVVSRLGKQYLHNVVEGGLGHYINELGSEVLTKQIR